MKALALYHRIAIQIARMSAYGKGKNDRGIFGGLWCGLVTIKNRLGPRHLAADALCRARGSVRLAEDVRFGVRHGPSTPATPSLTPPPHLHAHKCTIAESPRPEASTWR